MEKNLNQKCTFLNIFLPNAKGECLMDYFHCISTFRWHQGNYRLASAAEI